LAAPGTLNKIQFFSIISAALGVLWLLYLFVPLKNGNETTKTSSQQQVSKEESPPPPQTLTAEEKSSSATAEDKGPPQQPVIGEQKARQRTEPGEDKTPSKQTVAQGKSGLDALHLGDSFFSTKAYDQAIQQYDYAIDHGAPAHYVRGVAWLEKQNYEQAIADFTETIQREAGYYLAYFHRADAYARKGDRDAAIADYRRALALKPDEAVKKQIIAGLERLGAEPELQKDLGAQETKRRKRTKNR
jgi:tetratricopeptide (TPR) repeat protein